MGRQVKMDCRSIHLYMFTQYTAADRQRSAADPQLVCDGQVGRNAGGSELFSEGLSGLVKKQQPRLYCRISNN